MSQMRNQLFDERIKSKLVHLGLSYGLQVILNCETQNYILQSLCFVSHHFLNLLMIGDHLQVVYQSDFSIKVRQ